jgi:GNAT superfamily N-acetyltransferase
MDFRLHLAAPADTADLLALIRGLAAYEDLSHLCENTEERLHAALFGPRPHAEALLARDAASGEALGFALYFFTYSTFLGKPSLYLEDLFVQPTQRRRGIGRALLTRLASLASECGCGRFEWSVLDWNTPAQDFYRSLGATILPDWRIVRMTAAEISHLAGSLSPQPAHDVTAPG